MKKVLMMLSILSLFSMVSCEKNEKENDENSSIVGEWTMFRDPETKADAWIHFSFKADGTYVQTMPAWDESRYGNYEVKDDVIEMKCTKLEWVLPRDNGYRNVYDQYAGDPFSEKIPDFEDFAKAWPEEVEFSVHYALKDGNLILIEGVFGLENGVFEPDTKFDAVAECRKHLIVY